MTMEKAIDTALPHMFSIKVLDQLPGLFKPQRYLYHCARCKWSFVINDGRRGALRPIADGIKPLTHDEAAARAATFAAGPCPAMHVVAEAHRRLYGNGSRDHKFPTVHNVAARPQIQVKIARPVL